MPDSVKWFVTTGGGFFASCPNAVAKAYTTAKNKKTIAPLTFQRGNFQQIAVQYAARIGI